MTEVVACIPTIGASADLDDLVYALDRQDVISRLYVNSEHVTESLLYLVEGWPLPDGPELWHVAGQSIYASWNHAAAWAREIDAHLLVLNDDIVIPERLVASLHDALEGHPEYGLIGVSAGHVFNEAPYSMMPCSHAAGNRYTFSAWCFIARACAWQDVDEGYRVWYGDDDLIWKVNASGCLTGVLHGTGVEHHVSTTTRQVPGAMEQAHQDGILWMNTH